MTIKDIWNNAWLALKPEQGGFSIKKMATALFCAVAVELVFVYTNSENYLAVLGEIIFFILALLGLRSYEKNSILKSKKDEDNP